MACTVQDARRASRQLRHLEIRHAIELNKPRLFAVEQKVDYARQLLRPLVAKGQDGIPLWAAPNWAYPETVFRHQPIIDDLRVLEMYEEALLSDAPLMQRTDHWCQPYQDDARLFEFVGGAVSGSVAG